GAFGNTDGPGQVRQGGGLDEVAGAHQMPVAKWPGTGQSQAIAPDETGIADQVRGNGGCPPVTPVNPLDKIVVGIRLVHKTLPRAVDGDEPGFLPIEDQMGKANLPAVMFAEQRYGGKKHRVGIALAQGCADGGGK